MENWKLDEISSDFIELKTKEGFVEIEKMRENWKKKGYRLDD